MKILVLNAGSSSQKSCLYEFKEEELSPPSQPLWEAEIDWTHHRGLAELQVTTSQGVSLEETLPSESRSDATGHMLKTLWSGTTKVISQPSAIDIVGHRVVHGGREYEQSTFVTPKVKAAIARLAELAPAHNPANLAGVEAIEQTLGAVPQVAVFDTAFHAQMPEPAAIYPGPYEWLKQGIRRYGFHGISHQYCAARAAEILDRDLKDLRLITCHLGNGCSLAAIRGGGSVDTTMGFTPLEGLMMGSRSGSIDPGLLLHLLRQPDCSIDELDRILNQESGLKGISGLSNDLREVLVAMGQGNSRAQLAFDMYVHSLRSHIGANAGYTRFFVPFPKLEINQAALKRALASGGPLLSAVGIDLETPLVSLVMRALSQRPDLVVSLAQVRAAEDKIKATKASYFPKIAALANVGYGEERVSIGSNTIDSSAPTFGAGLAFELQVFDGFLRDRSLQAARAELPAASEQLEQTREINT